MLKFSVSQGVWDTMSDESKIEMTHNNLTININNSLLQIPKDCKTYEEYKTKMKPIYDGICKSLGEE